MLRFAMEGWRCAHVSTVVSWMLDYAEFKVAHLRFLSSVFVFRSAAPLVGTGAFPFQKVLWRRKVKAVLAF